MEAAAIESQSDWRRELEAFDSTKAGVKGLVDSGIMRIPRMFVHDESTIRCISNVAAKQEHEVPLIDLEKADEDRSMRADVVEKVRDACEKWGLFQVVGHGIPLHVLEEMVDGIRRFHEQDNEVKKAFYTRDYTRNVIFNSNLNLYRAKAVCWRDTLSCALAPRMPNAEELPDVCRYV